MDALNPDQPPPEATQHPGKPRLSNRILAACAWSAVVVTVAVLAWIATHPFRSTDNRLLSTATVDSQPDAGADTPTTGMPHRKVVIVSNTITTEGLEIGESWDDPPADTPERPVPELRMPEEVPASQRWQINFPDGTKEADYARQLAALGVELGVLRRDGTIEYLTNPGEAKPIVRSGPRTKEKRIYWTWDRGSLVKADHALLRKAGIDAREDLILHLWPPATSDKLAKLEQDYKGRQPRDIFVTRFAVKRASRGYEVYVLSQVGR